MRMLIVAVKVCVMLAAHAGAVVAQGDLDKTAAVSQLTVEQADALVNQNEALNLNRLTELTPSVAQALAQCRGRLSLNGVTVLTGDTAAALAQHKGRLCLEGLATLTPEVADGLSQHRYSRGSDDTDGLILSGLTSLSFDAAKKLATYEGPLELSGMDRMTAPVAGALAQNRYWLGLNGLASISPDVARRLAASGAIVLSLNGLTTLSPEVAQELAVSKAKFMWLQGLEDIDPEAAVALLGYQGKMIVSDAVSARLGMATKKRLVQLLTADRDRLKNEAEEFKRLRRFVDFNRVDQERKKIVRRIADINSTPDAQIFAEWSEAIAKVNNLKSYMDYVGEVGKSSSSSSDRAGAGGPATAVSGGRQIGGAAGEAGSLEAYQVASLRTVVNNPSDYIGQRLRFDGMAVATDVLHDRARDCVVYFVKGDNAKTSPTVVQGELAIVASKSLSQSLDKPLLAARDDAFAYYGRIKRQLEGKDPLPDSERQDAGAIVSKLWATVQKSEDGAILGVIDAIELFSPFPTDRGGTRTLYKR